MASTSKNAESVAVAAPALQATAEVDELETRGFTMPKSMFRAIQRLATYNKYHQRPDDSASAVVRTAINAYFEGLEDEGFAQYQRDISGD
jgi:hypothetical protein